MCADVRLFGLNSFRTTCAPPDHRRSLSYTVAPIHSHRRQLHLPVQSTFPFRPVSGPGPQYYNYSQFLFIVIFRFVKIVYSISCKVSFRDFIISIFVLLWRDISFYFIFLRLWNIICFCFSLFVIINLTLRGTRNTIKWIISFLPFPHLDFPWSNDLPTHFCGISMLVGITVVVPVVLSNRLCGFSYQWPAHTGYSDVRKISSGDRRNIRSDHSTDVSLTVCQHSYLFSTRRHLTVQRSGWNLI